MSDETMGLLIEAGALALKYETALRVIYALTEEEKVKAAILDVMSDETNKPPVKE